MVKSEKETCLSLTPVVSKLLQDTALAASYVLVGVKDQRQINMMVADSLLNNKEQYLSDRFELARRLSLYQLNLLDSHHNLGSNNVQTDL